MTCESLGCIVIGGLITTASEAVGHVYNALFASWPGKTILTIYTIGVGYAIMFGHTGARTKQWATSVLLLIVMSGFVSTFDTFSEWVGVPIWEAAIDAGSLAATGGETTHGGLAGILDATEQSLGKTFAVLDNVSIPGNFFTQAWIYMKVGVVVLLLGLLICAMYITVTALLCIASFSLLMMFAIGGPCLWLVSFKETRHITWAWVRAVFNYSLWIFFIGLVSGVANWGVGITVDHLQNWDLERDGIFNQVVGANMMLTALSTYMLLKSSEWAAAITGGTASNTGAVGMLIGAGGYSVGSGLNALGGAAGNAVRAYGPAIGRGTAGLAIRAYSALRGIK